MQDYRNYHLTKGEKVSMWILRLAEEGRFRVLDDMFTCQISAAIANIYLGTACDKENKIVLLVVFRENLYRYCIK